MSAAVYNFNAKRHLWRSPMIVDTTPDDTTSATLLAIRQGWGERQANVITLRASRSKRPERRQQPALDISRLTAWSNTPWPGKPVLLKWVKDKICCIHGAEVPPPEPEPSQPDDAAQSGQDKAPDPCEASVLTSVNGRLMAKRHRWDGEKVVTTQYDLERDFTVTTVKLGDFTGMVALLGDLAKHPNAIIVRGEPLPETNRAKCRRLYYPDAETGEAATFRDAKRQWFAIDMDHVPCPAQINVVADPDAAIVYLISLLPAELHTGSCWWQLTSSQGLPGHEDTLSARLWFWNREPLGDVELKRWALAVNKTVGRKLVDPKLYCAVQPHYLASPVFDGMPDPVPSRHGVHRGLDGTVSLVIPELDPVDDPVVYVPGRGIGRGIDYYIERIGGEDGFRAPMTSAIGAFFASGGPDADPGPIKARLRKAILVEAPPGGRDKTTIERYASDRHLDSIIGWVKGQERAKRAANGDARGGNSLDLDEAIARRKIDESRRRCMEFIAEQGAAVRADPELVGLPDDALQRLFDEADAKGQTKPDPAPRGARDYHAVRLRGRLEALNAPPPEMAVEALVPKLKLILPWGYTGEGKTYFIAELASAISDRRPAFGKFKVLLPGDSGVTVLFLGEDCPEFDFSRLTAIELYHGIGVGGLDGKIFTTDIALPLDDRERFNKCRNEMRRIQDVTGKPIDAAFDETLGRSLGMLNPNAGETGHQFTAMFEALIDEFECPFIVTGHEPKTGGTISGTQRFLDNAPVTPHIQGVTNSCGQLIGFTVVMHPKYRIGPKPKPFRVKAVTVSELPVPVNGSTSDLVFKYDGELSDKPKGANLSPTGQPGKALKLLISLIEKEGRPDEHGRLVVEESLWREVCDANRLSKGDSESAARNASNLAKRELLRGGYIGTDGEFVWLVRD